MRQPPAAALALAEVLLQDVVNRDEAARAGLATLDGSAVALQLHGIDLQLFVTVTGPRLALHRQLDREPQVRLSGTPAAFARLWRERETTATAATQDAVAIQGNLATATAWQNWLRQLEFDWEEWLATLLGDVPARQLARAARGVAAWTEATIDTVRLNASEYLHEEARLVPEPERIAASGAAIDRLAQEVDAVAARVQRLLQRHGR
ncbi:MAG: SCP2 sterol-binding domain-containing protein [Gammaproteobacteria bacterium]|nr:SCP2 sterol-binding domain-containing protein [Gammaproteobacteria bacterium]